MGELTSYTCGSTSHDMAQLLRGAPREKRVFPSNAFLYSSGVRRVLFDTGYAPRPWRTGLAGWAYRRLLPPRIEAGDTIGEQIDASQVTHVVLSHLHPDHIGGAAAFPHATFVLSSGLLQTLAGARPKDGLLRGLLPPWFETADRVVVTEFEDGPSGLRTHDLFGDGTCLLVDLPGHALGHMGALIEGRVLLTGDAAWGRELLGQESRIRALPRAVSHDPEAQIRTAGALLRAEEQGVRLLFSHDEHPPTIDLA